MKKRLLLLTGLLLFCCVFSGCQVESTQKLVKIALITKSNTSFFWQTVLAGVNAAQDEYTNVQVITKAANTEDDYITQNQYIENAWKIDKVDVIVLSASSYTESTAIIQEAMEAGVRFLLIDSGVNDTSIPYIGTNNFAAGEQAGMEMATLLDEKGKIGIVSFEESSGNGKQRIEGVLSALGNYPECEIVDIRYAKSNNEDPYAQTNMLLNAYPDLDAIITLNELTTLGVGRAVRDKDLGNRIHVIGFDNHINAVAMMEAGIIDGLIVQNPYAMGYLSVENALQIVNFSSVESIETPTVFVTKQNMYEQRFEKILFPLT